MMNCLILETCQIRRGSGVCESAHRLPAGRCKEKRPETGGGRGGEFGRLTVGLVYSLIIRLFCSGPTASEPWHSPTWTDGTREAKVTCAVPRGADEKMETRR